MLPNGVDLTTAAQLHDQGIEAILAVAEANPFKPWKRTTIDLYRVEGKSSKLIHTVAGGRSGRLGVTPRPSPYAVDPQGMRRLRMWIRAVLDDSGMRSDVADALSAPLEERTLLLLPTLAQTTSS